MREHFIRRRLSNLRGWLGKKLLPVGGVARALGRHVRGSGMFVRRLPWTWIVATIAFGVSGLSLTVSGVAPLELSAPITTATFVVLLSELLRRISAENKRQRELGFVLWLIHHEMSAHWTYREDMLTSLKTGAKVEVKNGSLLLSAIPVSPILSDAWEIFTTAGGLQTMLDYAPRKTVANLFCYYYSIQDFNAYNAKRQEYMNSSLNMTVQQMELMAENMNGIGESMIELLEKEMPPLLTDLTEEIQQVLLDLRQPLLWAAAIPGQGEALKTVVDRDTRRYYRWRRTHGLFHTRHMSRKDQHRGNGSRDNEKERP